LQFQRYLGIDYSGARTPTASVKGLRVYEARPESREPLEVPPPPSRRRYWTRRGVAEWLLRELARGEPTIVGIDHGFSFPLAYFERYGLARDWPAFLDDFVHHWPTAGDSTSVAMIRRDPAALGSARTGSARWRRLTERRVGRAKSVFHFDVPGSVATSTHAGVPWLRFLRQHLGARIHFWPFDGWKVPVGRSVVAEVYPSLWSAGIARADRTPDQHDAYAVAAWLRDSDRSGALASAFAPALSEADRAIARCEGWILGVL
jgi:hypothetical protein